jgi:uncharacterized protein YrzB (UPF0473 family)
MIQELGINLDSLKEAHSGARMMVMKDENGKITVRECDDQAAWVSEEHECEHGGKTYQIIVTDEGQPGENEEMYILKTADGKKVKVISEKTVVISTTDEDEDGQVKVIVVGDDGEKTEKNVTVTVKVLDEDREDARDNRDVKEKKVEKTKK